MAAVLCAGIALFVVLLDGRWEIDGAPAALARMMQAMDKMPVMHEVYRTNYGGPETHESETWYDFASRTVLARYATDGQCVKISSLNYGTMEDVVYEPKAGIVKIVYRCDVGGDGYPDSPAKVVQEYLDWYESRGARITRGRSPYQEVDADVYTFEIEANEHRHKERATLTVDRRTDLPLAMTWKSWTKQGDAAFDQTKTFDFPAGGLRDIYEMGAPRSAEVVLDVVSQERYERKQALEQRMPRLEQEFQHAYCLPQGQVLLWVPPAMAGARTELEQTREEIDRLVAEQVEERLGKSQLLYQRAGLPEPVPEPRVVFRCFESDGVPDWRRSRATFAGGATFKQAFEGIIGLTHFEYDIPAGISDINIPGDWVVEKDGSKEKRIAALEKTVQDFTGRSLQFRSNLARREVIVARGSFHFHPLSGTYNDTWIHVYADELDPDERSGGGSGSLAKFIRCLGEVNFNQQVVDETQGDGEVEVHYGWHKSGYIRLIPDEKERKIKLPMVLDNVARQTGLTFSVERRTMLVWTVVEDK